jgi:hypothetical protein
LGYLNRVVRAERGQEIGNDPLAVGRSGQTARHGLALPVQELGR